MELKIISLLTITLLIISVIKSRKKTVMALRTAFTKFIGLMPALLLMVITVSFITAFLPEEMISGYLSGEKNKLAASAAAALIGSVSLMPGFIAFPLAGILRENGVLYMVIASFTTTLMMVGIVTLPIERKYFGIKVALIRNGIALITAFAVTLAAGIVFGELRIW